MQSRKQIRVLYPEIAPAIYRCLGKFPRIRPHPVCKTPGFMAEIFVTITDELGLEMIPMTVDPINKNDSLYLGAVVGNASTGLLDYILDDRVDTLAIPFHDYGASSDVFDVTFPIYNTTAFFFYGKQLHTSNSWFEFFQVYNKAVWFSLLGLWLLVTLFLHVAKCLEVRLLRKARPSLKQRMRYQCQIVWYALQFMLGHPQFDLFKSSAVNFGLLILSCCYGITIMGIYGSWILSLKLNPSTMPPIKDIDSLAELIRNSEFRMIATPPKALDFTLLRRADLLILKSISDALHHNPIHLSRSDSGIIDNLIQDRSVVYVEADEQLYLDLQKHCGIEELTEHISNIPAVFVFRKGSRFIKSFNSVIDKRRDLFLKIINRYLGLSIDEINNRPCTRDKEKERLPYYGLCAMSLVMCSFGVIILIAENIFYYVTRSSSKPKVDNKKTEKKVWRRSSSI